MQTYSNMKFPVCLWFESLNLIMPVHAKAKSGSLTWPIWYEWTVQVPVFTLDIKNLYEIIHIMLIIKIKLS